jgi:hypothetical protein
MDVALRTTTLAEVVIRRNADGATRVYNDPYPWNEFLWADGNYACDCNRELLFARAGGDPDPDWWSERQAPCGEGRYSVFYDGREIG